MFAKARFMRKGSTETFTERFNATQIEKMPRRSSLFGAQTVSVWVAYVAMIACNVAFESGRLGGVTSAEVSNEMFVWFMPEGYVFAIWGLIYLALAAWLVQFTRRASQEQPDAKGTALLFVVSCALNVAWLALFHFRQVEIAWLVIAALLVVMLALYSRVRTAQPALIARMPIALYAAWLIVAVIANTTLVATWATGGGIYVLNELFVLVLSACALAIGYISYRRTDDIVFPLVVLWAVIGVGVHVAEKSVLISMAVFLLVIVGVVATFASWGKVRAMFAHVSQ